MALGNGARLGTYEVVGLLGAGGMGEVYLARDAKLKREVAIKVLPGTFAHDTGRVARLQREAEILASLNHPHIAAIYELVESGPSPFLVLELVDGETLADRLARGRLPCQEALTIARQIAEALEAAHDKGIVHRDLKPANIKITSGGNVKVLDFGLAKGPIAADASLDPSHSPTMMATMPGAILGTAAYMAPEQAAGREADRGSDVWSFACVLYEMMTGVRAFAGATASEILAEVLKSEPDWQRLPADTPSGIRRLLRRCLKKDQQQRPRDIRDVRLEIDEVRGATSQSDDATTVPPWRRERLLWASALVLVALTALLFGLKTFGGPPVPSEQRLDLNGPSTSDPSVAISPDGQKVLFTGRDGGPSQLWLRSLDSSTSRALPGTERGTFPFWSPDGRSIGFFSDTRLKRMDIDGLSAETLASDAAVGLGGSWSNDGTIIFSKDPGSPIYRVPAAGGDVVPVTRLGPQERGHSFPRFLPDGRHFLFFVDGTPDVRGVYAGQIDSMDHRRLLDAVSPATYATSGYLLFVRDRRLMAQVFDPVRLELAGEAFPIVDGITGGTSFAVSTTRTIVYRTASPDSGQRQLVWVDRSGREISKEVYADNAAPGLALSHDGRYVAVYRFANGNMDIWSYEISRRAWDRITFDSGDDISPLWSRDGGSIIFGSARKNGVVGLFRRRLHAADEPDEQLLVMQEPAFPMDWSADGRLVLYTSLNAKTGFDIWMLPLDGDRRPVAVVQTPFNEGLAQFSSDGKWLAYQSDKTGRFEIYVRPFPGPGGDVRVSTEGGTQPRWRPDGTEMFYVSPDERLMAVPIAVRPPQTIAPGPAVGLFTTKIGYGPRYRQQYSVSADGRSFVVQTAVGDSKASPITVILNWKPNPR